MSERLRQWRQALFLGYHRMFQRYPWQWICHLTFNDDYSTDVVNEMLLRWTRDLQITEHIQIAYVKVICFRREHPHLHLLVFGRGKYKGEIITLEDVSPRKWASKWPFFAKIEPIEDHYRATRYEALQTFKYKCDEYEIDYYNLKLLRQLRD
jgi:hypothetical protein